jgi:ubiquinone/menaquinone biosynthesis C-methylase UbiE
MVAIADVRTHYGTESICEKVEKALQDAGYGAGKISPADLAALDQFHTRGLAATIELADSLGIDAGSRVLDIGAGLGGSARHLAAHYGCAVQGIDASAPFVEAATYLNQRTGLADKVSVQVADALDLPFADGSFDIAWTQHVAMNIADRPRLYREINRVLRRDGKLGIYDVVAGDGPVFFPVPWASSPATSFLLQPSEMTRILDEAGFNVVSSKDCSQPGIAFFQRLRESPPKSPLGLPTVMGPRFKEMSENFAQNLEAGHVKLVQAVFRKR